MKLKIGDEVETKEGFGDIKQITPYLDRPYQVYLYNIEKYYDYRADQLKLLPKLKTLAELGEGGGNKPFTAINSKGDKVKFLTIFTDYDDEIAALTWDHNEEVYDSYLGDQADWQLYQEPEEAPFEEALDKATTKPAEKCEHKIPTQNGDGKSWCCSMCGVELVEKWLWIVSLNDEHFIYDSYLTEREAKEHKEFSFLKKATNSRIRVGNEKLD